MHSNAVVDFNEPFPSISSSSSELSRFELKNICLKDYFKLKREADGEIN